MAEEVRSQEREPQGEGEQREQAGSTPREKRPFRVTLLAVVVLIIASIHLIRFIASIYLWDFLLSLPRISPPYLALTGLVWAIIGLPLFWWLWRGHPLSPTVTRVIALAYTLYYWLDRTFVANASAERANWPFAAGMTALILVYIWWILSRPSSYRFFHRMRPEADTMEAQEVE